MHLHDALAALGLSAMPADAAEAKRAWRSAAMRSHPDRGGSHADFVRVQAAMERVIEHMAAPHADVSRHSATYPDRLRLAGPVSPHQPVWSPPVDLRSWWREQAMLEIGLGTFGWWTREGTLRGGIMPLRKKVRR